MHDGEDAAVTTSRPGPANDLTDVTGLAVGHHQRIGRGWLTGCTVVRCPPGTVGGVDVRGSAPGTRETDLLDPSNLVPHVDAICLTGGSAYGLAAAHGVLEVLEAAGRGFRVGPAATAVVPIVPGAVIFDLGRGGVFPNRPDASFGAAATRAAHPRRFRQGTVGAGTGAVAGGIKGGLGSASTVLADGTVVAALVVVNAVGSAVDPASGLPWGVRALLDGDSPPLRRPSALERRNLLAAATAPPALNTTIGVVATTAALGRAECRKLAAVGHDGLARAVRPAHAMTDGDTLFGLATATTVLSPERVARTKALNEVLAAAADTVERSVVRAVVAATGAGSWPSWSELCPSAYRRT